jgi:NADPH:quinone reductase-like Zn-dependent oxidoreductase
VESEGSAVVFVFSAIMGIRHPHAAIVCPEAPMQAITYRRYGPPEVLRLEEIPIPTPAANDVLIKVRAASVNPFDWHFMRGTPYGVRIIAGLSKPRLPQLGADAAGEVVAVGAEVTHVKPGDQVFGMCRGAYAEYACASESKLAIKPENIAFDQAASVPIAACTALLGLREKGHIQPGHQVLVNGAAGGVGTFGVQLAKAFGAHVTGVTSTRNLDLVRSIGADHIIDYAQQNFTEDAAQYDVILDTVGNHPISALKRVLKPNGISVSAGGTSDDWMLRPIAHALHSLFISSVSDRKFVGVLGNASTENLTAIAELLQTGKVTPVIDRYYPLSQVPEAIRYLEAGHARGKVIITINS